MGAPGTSITHLKGVGERRAALLNKLGLFTAGDLLRFYPRAYIDLSQRVPLESVLPGETCCFLATLTSPVRTHRVRGNMVLYKFTVSDLDSPRPQTLPVTLFNNKYLAERLSEGKQYLFYGRIEGGFTGKQMTSPEIEAADSALIRPVYRSTEGLNSRMIAGLVHNALTLVSTLPDPFPAALKERLGLIDLTAALHDIHAPADGATLERARRRLVFDELFMLQVGLLMVKERGAERPGAVIEKDFTEEFYSLLPFAPTNAQRRAVADCVQDISMGGRAMNRLIQGDVGSGKTAVAAAVCHTVTKNGYQCALMAPTELLADQHYRTLNAMFRGTGVRPMLLTGSSTAAEKRRIYDSLAAGDIDVLVGTHALLEDKVQFAKLGLVVTDEQHRFGVGQRARLNEKGDRPHLCVMSATPIPRTLALIIYGDLDISVLDEKPPGRQEIDTYAVASSYHNRVYTYVKKHLDSGLQGYIVCPLVEDNDSALVSVTQHYKELSEGMFAGYTVGLLHGRMKAADKERVMRGFAAGEVQLLVATTVIEVGVDVPNAVIMVIENAERFGLSQLHQLRGRVGRGDRQSTCILISDSQNEATQERLKVMAQTGDGFVIAEEDLRLRGSGDFFGDRQHGLPEMRLANLLTDMTILRLAADEAHALLAADSTLADPAHRTLREQVGELFRPGGAAL